MLAHASMRPAAVRTTTCPFVDERCGGSLAAAAEASSPLLVTDSASDLTEPNVGDEMDILADIAMRADVEEDLDTLADIAERALEDSQ